MDLRAQHEDATEVNEWIKFGMRIAVSREIIINLCENSIFPSTLGQFNTTSL